VFGTDSLGRDIAARIAYGARYSLLVALAALAVAGVVGIAAGIASGFAPRWVGAVVMRLADAALGIPLFLVALTLAVVRGPGIANVVLIIGGLLWAQYARIVSLEVARIRELAYIDASRVLGTPTLTIVLKHVLPNILPTVLTLLASQVGSVILLEASLSFLGAGVPPPAPAWGTLVAGGRDTIAGAWWVSTIPGLAILLVVIATNRVADWVQAVFSGSGAAPPDVVRASRIHSRDEVTPGPVASTFLRVDGLTVRTRGEDATTLVEDVSFDIRAGEFVGLIGESGSGKSITSYSLARLASPTLDVSARQLALDGEDLGALSTSQLQRIRGRRIGFMFQDHTMALDPTATVGSHLVEVLRRHRGMSRRAARSAALELLGDVGIPDARSRIDAYPHQFSGGMGQRVALAAALAGEPDLLIADEPTTALDATVQLRVLDLLKRASTERGMATLLVTHDLGVARRVCDRVLVMYAGRLVETGNTGDVLDKPASPYTSALLESLPSRAVDGHELMTIGGAPPAPGSIDSGCRFAARCSVARDVCSQEEPTLSVRVSDSQFARCWATEVGGWA
jgi:peptide/nickel transport system permease protein